MTQRRESTEREREQAFDCVVFHPQCNEGCSGEFEHSEVLWLYQEAMPYDERERYMAMGSGMAAALEARFGALYLSHDTTPLNPDGLLSGKERIVAVSEIEIGAADHRDDATTVLELRANHDSAMPKGVEPGDLVGYRARFACPWRLNTIRARMIEHDPITAAKMRIKVSGTAK